MSDEEDPALAAALSAEAATIAQRYRVEHDQALVAVQQAMRDASLAEAVRREVARGKGRGAALRRLGKDARRHVYHDLRRYTTDEQAQERRHVELRQAIDAGDADVIHTAARALLESHASTRERLQSGAAFAAIVEAAVGHPGSVVDLGCGLHPLTQFDAPATAPEVYLALDRDERAVEILATYAGALKRSRLIAERADLEQVDWSGQLALADVQEFDLAYLLKVVPVVRRQQPQALARMAEVPARTLMITGSKEALTRRHDISRREDAVLRRFVDSLDARSVERHETDDEIVYVVTR